jgi:arsenate reductase
VSPVGARKKVLFVCVGNCCRSQMAEGFARHHGSDVLVAGSAGIVPAGFVVEETVRSMAAKNIDISSHYSKPLRRDEDKDFDLIVNMSGLALPDGIRAPVVDWQVPDPIGKSENVYARVRDQIETLVMSLILELRRQRPGG